MHAESLPLTKPGDALTPGFLAGKHAAFTDLLRDEGIDCLANPSTTAVNSVARDDENSPTFASRENRRVLGEGDAQLSLSRSVDGAFELGLTFTELRLSDTPDS